MKATGEASDIIQRAVQCVVALLLAGLAGAAQFVFTGASWFNVTPAWRAYAGLSDWRSIWPAFQFDLEAVVPDLVGAALVAPGQTDEQWVARYTQVAAVVFLAVLLVAVALRRLTPLQVFFVVTLGQVVKVTLPWMGKPDLFLLAFLLICALWSDRRWSAVAAALAALTHPMAAALAIVALAAGRWALGIHRIGPIVEPEPAFSEGITGRAGSWCWRLERWVPALWPLLGVLVGLIAQATVMAVAFPGHVGRATVAVGYGAGLLLNALPNALAFTVLTLAAIVPPIMLGRRPTGRRGPKLLSVVTLRRMMLVGIATAIVLVAMFGALDHSRIATLLAFPLVVTAILRYRRELETALLQQPVLLAFLVVISMAVPPLAENGWIGYRFAPLAEWMDAVLANSAKQ
ncbi:hypothetical protein B0O41_3197 [Propionibacteriaceae bacterium ES.041]|nr:hypothetical protein B0O41_3197 [Propionibacteriaceae bacterium ES.041]